MEGLDRQLVTVAMEEAALRLRLGQALEVMRRLAHCFALGFSSLGAYAVERCDRSIRWVEAACCLARRLEELPILRQATAAGRISWSMAELVAREATASNEADWITLAQGHTLREMRRLVNEQRDRNRETENAKPENPACSPSAADAARRSPGTSEHASRPSASASEEEDREASCTLTCTLNREDFWLFEATRALLEHLGTHDGNDQIEALLAEGQATLLAALPRGVLHFDSLEPFPRTEPHGPEAPRHLDSEAELAAEWHLCGPLSETPTEVQHEIARDAAGGASSLVGKTALELDAIVRALSRSLAEHEFVFARLLLEFHQREGWRELGHATEERYARERLGLSRSSWLARRALAARLESLPAVAEALRTGGIGVEAACQVVRVAVPETEVAWVERARRRTVKHLREEVVAALTAVRISGNAECPPPLDAELTRYQDLERAVLSGRLWREPSEAGSSVESQEAAPSEAESTSCLESGGRRIWRAMLTSLGAWLTRGIRLSAASVQAWQGASSLKAANHSRIVHDRAAARTDRVEVRLRVSRSARAWWRGLEMQARRWLPRGVSWVRFLCLALWRDWHHLLGADVAYGGIYLRDRCQCSSPVCNRRDVTPHHLHFRSAGGDDSEANLTALCSWCHLFGVHGGRIRAQGEAPLIRWDLGPPLAPCLSVHGRERLGVTLF
jgi:hypothetical protein